jgi:hypothetical protein
MIFDDRIFQPYYIKASNGANAGFILSVLFCSKIETIERQIIYIFYMCNIIPHEFLKNKREKIDKEFLLKLIFELSAEKKCVSKKDLRSLTALEDRGTFNKYFGEHIKKLGLSRNKSFTLYETFKILQFWQGDDKWGSMEAFSKGELANRFMNGNYNELELKMTDEVFNYDEYKHHDFIKPADAKKFINKVLDKESLELIYEEDFNVDYLFYFFIMYLLYSFRRKSLSNHNL